MPVDPQLTAALGQLARVAGRELVRAAAQRLSRRIERRTARKTAVRLAAEDAEDCAAGIEPVGRFGLDAGDGRQFDGEEPLSP